MSKSAASFHICFKENQSFSQAVFPDSHHLCQCALNCTKHRCPLQKEKKKRAPATPFHSLPPAPVWARVNKFWKYGLGPEANLAVLWQKHLTRTREKINVKIGFEKLNVFHWGNKAVPSLVRSDADLRETHATWQIKPNFNTLDCFCTCKILKSHNNRF